MRSVPICECVCVCACACTHARVFSNRHIHTENHIYIYTYILVLLSFVLIQSKNMLTIPGKRKVMGACICVSTCVFVRVLTVTSHEHIKKDTTHL